MGRSIQPDARALAQVEMELIERLGDLRHPVLAIDMCVRASKYARGRLGGRCVAGVHPIAPDGLGKAYGHVGLLIGRTIYDYTARQFWPDTPWPLVEPVRAWAERYNPSPDLTDEQRRVWYPGWVTTYHTFHPHIIVPYPKARATCSAR